MKNDLIFAFRNIGKNKTNSIITVIGLSVGIACALLIYLFVSQEFSYNSFHVNKESIYRVSYKIKLTDGNIYENVLLTPELADILKNKVPQVQAATAYRADHEEMFKYNNNYFTEHLGFAEPDFFNIFSFSLIEGQKDKIFQNPNDVIITRKLANKFLQTKKENYSDLIGQNIELLNNIPFVITGILEDVPENSSIDFDFILSYEYQEQFSSSNNNLGNSIIYVQLKKDAEKTVAQKNINKVINEFYKSNIEQAQQQNIIAKSSDCFVPYLTSLKDTYLNSSAESDYEKHSNSRYSYILMAIGMLILIIACLNFIILTFGQSINKISEVGVRKINGAGSGNIFSLFLSEAMLLTLMALISGIVLCYLLIPVFSKLSHTEIYTEVINLPKTFLSVVTGFLFIVLFISIIPVLFFTNIKPGVMPLKKGISGKKGIVSQLFIAVQFSLSIVLIVVSIFIARQTDYLKNKSLGLTTENIIDLNVSYLGNNQRLSINENLRQCPGIINTTICDRDFLNGSSSRSVEKNESETVEVRIIKVDNNYIPTLDLKILEGQNFSVDNVRQNDKTVVINKKLARLFEFSNPIGKTININGGDQVIIGMVDDFHFDSMKDDIEPLALYTRTNYGNNYNAILIKYYPEQLSSVVSFIKKRWKETAPELDIKYTFWDEELGKRYEEEERWSKIVGYASSISIVISLLGLFGLTILLINQRIKEIGIRKVNGAKVHEVIGMFNQNFMIWLILAFIIACPLAYLIIEKWLEGFTYKIPINWWVFILTGAGSVCIALLTVSLQSFKAARKNPVEALRYE